MHSKEKVMSLIAFTILGILYGFITVARIIANRDNGAWAIFYKGFLWPVSMLVGLALFSMFAFLGVCIFGIAVAAAVLDECRG
jgi:hypothetical protein